MSDVAKPLVYLVLGATGSGRREVLADLIAAGLEEKDRAAVMLSDAEAPDATEGPLGAITRWQWLEGAIVGTLPEGATHVFFVVDGRRNPIDQIEVFKPWLEAQGGKLARSLCVVNFQLVAAHPSLLGWYEACIHFADVVFLNRREGVENKVVSDFLAHFKKLYFPCLFEMVKDGQVKNPALVLEPEARRMTHVFDEEQNWVFTNAEGEEIDEQEETKGADDNEEIEAKPEEDPYFERMNGGRRLKPIPDIGKFL
ncbi:MAG TPA: hypothetical protein VM029_10850 [Opitutaceae bacterium]|nr:hypothetical protein [Opitutaceae bacterium]